MAAYNEQRKTELQDDIADLIMTLASLDTQREALVELLGRKQAELDEIKALEAREEG